MVSPGAYVCPVPHVTPLPLKTVRSAHSARRPFLLWPIRPVPVVDNAYPYLYGPAPKISTSDYIGTGDSHNPTSSQSHRPIIGLLLPGIPNGNRTDKLYGYGYKRGSGRVDQHNRMTLTPVAIGVARILSGVHFSSPKKLTTSKHTHKTTCT